MARFSSVLLNSRTYKQLARLALPLCFSVHKFRSIKTLGGLVSSETKKSETVGLHQTAGLDERDERVEKVWLAWTSTDTAESYEAKSEKPARDMALEERKLEEKKEARKPERSKFHPKRKISDS